MKQARDINTWVYNTTAPNQTNRHSSVIIRKEKEKKNAHNTFISFTEPPSRAATQPNPTPPDFGPPTPPYRTNINGSSVPKRGEKNDDHHSRQAQASTRALMP